MIIENMIQQHKERLYSLCLYLEKNKYAAEELFQETWVKVIEKKDTYKDSNAYYPWLSQIAVNLYRDRLRKIKVEIKNRFLVDDFNGYDKADKSIDVEAYMIKQDEIHKTKACIACLEDKYKIPLILSVKEAFTYKQIAEVLDISEGLVKSRVHDAREKLKKLLAKEGLDER